MKRLIMTAVLALLAAAAMAAPANALPPVEVVNAHTSEACWNATWGSNCVIEEMEGTFYIPFETWPATCDATFDFHIEADGAFELRNVELTDAYGWPNCYGPGIIGSGCRVDGVATWPGVIESATSQETFTGVVDICYGDGYHVEQQLDILEDQGDPAYLGMFTGTFELPAFNTTGDFSAETSDSTVEIISNFH